MRGANRVIKYICMECYKEFAPIHKESAIAHVNFSHSNVAYIREVKDES